MVADIFSNSVHRLDSKFYSLHSLSIKSRTHGYFHKCGQYSNGEPNGFDDRTERDKQFQNVSADLLRVHVYTRIQQCNIYTVFVQICFSSVPTQFNIRIYMWNDAITKLLSLSLSLK